MPQQCTNTNNWSEKKTILAQQKTSLLLGTEKAEQSKGKFSYK